MNSENPTHHSKRSSPSWPPDSTGHVHAATSPICQKQSIVPAWFCWHAQILLMWSVFLYLSVLIPFIVMERWLGVSTGCCILKIYWIVWHTVAWPVQRQGPKPSLAFHRQTQPAVFFGTHTVTLPLCRDGHKMYPCLTPVEPLYTRVQ